MRYDTFKVRGLSDWPRNSVSSRYVVNYDSNSLPGALISWFWLLGTDRTRPNFVRLPEHPCSWKRLDPLSSNARNQYVYSQLNLSSLSPPPCGSVERGWWEINSRSQPLGLLHVDEEHSPIFNFKTRSTIHSMFLPEPSRKRELSESKGFTCSLSTTLQLDMCIHQSIYFIRPCGSWMKLMLSSEHTY
jgi:hypothetical protein